MQSTNYGLLIQYIKFNSPMLFPPPPPPPPPPTKPVILILQKRKSAMFFVSEMNITVNQVTIFQQHDVLAAQYKQNESETNKTVKQNIDVSWKKYC